MLILLPSSDEVAAFLLQVKTLDYQDKPDYQHLKKLLAGSVGGQLDFSVPERPAVKTSNTREKVRTPRGVGFWAPLPGHKNQVVGNNPIFAIGFRKSVHQKILFYMV